MTKEALVLLLLVAGTAVGILYVVRQASSNESDWVEYENVRLGASYSSVKARFMAASDDLRTLGDARTAGYSSAFKEAVEAGGVRMIIVPSREDAFIFAFDKDDKVIYKNFRRP